jgi:hypothetical protein
MMTSTNRDSLCSVVASDNDGDTTKTDQTKKLTITKPRAWFDTALASRIKKLVIISMIFLFVFV